jgi:hypothetical protein
MAMTIAGGAVHKLPADRRNTLLADKKAKAFWDSVSIDLVEAMSLTHPAGRPLRVREVNYYAVAESDRFARGRT